MPHHNGKKLKTLERRVKHLEARVKDNFHNIDLSFDKAELSALKWALKVLYNYVYSAERAKE